MFSAWDFNSWLISVEAVVFMLSVLTVFGVFVTALITRIWGEEHDIAATPHLSGEGKESVIRKAA